MLFKQNHFEASHSVCLNSTTVGRRTKPSRIRDPITVFYRGSTGYLAKNIWHSGILAGASLEKSGISIQWLISMMGHRWQRIRTSTQGMAFVLENQHHQHVKPPTTATLRVAFVLENQHHQHAKLAPPATLRHAFVLENPHHQHVKPTPPATFNSLTMSTPMSK